MPPDGFANRPLPAAWIAVASLALIGVLGCSSSRKGDPNGRVVTGKVTYQGNPVDSANVTFVSKSHSAFGRTDAEGKFKLAIVGGDQIPLGSYQVSIVKKEAPTVVQTSSDPNVIPDDYVSPDPDAPPPPEPKDLLPAKYAIATTSGLSAEVTADGKNEFEFPLAD